MRYSFMFTQKGTSIYLRNMKHSEKFELGDFGACRCR